MEILVEEESESPKEEIHRCQGNILLSNHTVQDLGAQP